MSTAHAASALGRLALGLACAELASGHAYLADPPSRNMLKYSSGAETCPHCLQGGGPGTVSARANVWPTRLAPEGHGLCGDPVQGMAVVNFDQEPYMTFSGVQRQYRPGEIVEFQVGVSTHHMGHYEFRICNKPLDTQHFGTAAEAQDCLDSYVLERAPLDSTCVVNDARGDCQPIDEKHPERWYLPPPVHDWTLTAGKDFVDSQASPLPALTELHIMKYKIPDDLHCEKCTLQWYYVTGNSCFYDGDYIDYFHKMKSLGWDAEPWAPAALASWATADNVACKAGRFGEEFWNCADVAVTGEAGRTTTTVARTAGATTHSAPGKVTTTTGAPGTATTMVAEAESEPELEPEAEAEAEPELEAEGEAEAEAEAAPTAPGGDSMQCGQLQDQCGGDTFSGEACCQPGLACVADNQWWHSCQIDSTSSYECAQKNGQCGGQGYTGKTCCAPGLVCEENTVWYHQCNRPSSLAQVSPHGKVAAKKVPLVRKRRKSAFMALVQEKTRLGQQREPEEWEEESSRDEL